MDKLLKYFFVYFTIVLFIAATSGVRMYSHYCETTDVAYASLIKSLATCEEHETKDASTSACEAKSCCDSETQSKAQDEADDCCSDETRFVKLTDDFIFAPSQFEKTLQLGLLVLMQTTTDLALNQELTTSQNWLIPPVHPHPPKSGKTLVVFLQQQKADPNLSA